MSETKKHLFANTVKEVVEYVAVKKANANCYGFMYKPERPKKIIEKEQG